MKLPSFHLLLTGVKNVVLRFPFETLAVFVGTSTALYMSDFEQSWGALFDNLIRLLLTSHAALLLFLSATFIAETRSVNKWILRSVALVLCILLFFSLHPEKEFLCFPFYLLLSAALHLLVSFAPYLKGNTTYVFWQFNKSLFLRFLTSALYSAVIFGGLALALFAIQELFEVNINEKFYFRLWIVVAGIFNTLFFLAGIPHDLATPVETTYPKGLKIFTQFVLLPLVTIYLVILLLYEFKITFLWSLPKGWVSNLIIAYGIFGILSILLVYPIRNNEQDKWIRIFSKSFYYLLIPLLVLLYIAILKRIEEYGFTESRYLVLIVGMWLTGIAAYFILSPKYNIKVIPISLFIVTLLSAIGPQSAFSVSEHSQRSVIRNVFEKNHLVTDGKIRPLSDKDTLSREDHKRSDNAIEYLVTHHGVRSLIPLFPADFDTVIQNIYEDNLDTAGQLRFRNWESSWATANKVTAYLNLKHVYGNEDTPTEEYTYCTNEDDLFAVGGYDLFCASEYNASGTSFQSSSNTITIGNFDSTNKWVIRVNGDSLVADINPMLQKLPEGTEDGLMSGEKMETVAESKKHKVKIIFKNISFNTSDNKSRKINYCSFYVLVKKL